MPTSTTAFSYASAALAFLLFSLLLLTGWRQRPHRRWLLAASLLTVLWGAVMACATVVPWAPCVLHGAEWLRNALRSRLERRRDADSLALGAVQRTGVSFTEVASQQAERGKYEDAQYQPAAGDAVERGHRSDGRAGHDARGTLVDRERRKAPSRPFVGSTSVPASLLRRAICSES